MPRLLSSLSFLGVLTPVVLVLPVTTAPAVAPHPVPASVSHVALGRLPVAAGSAVGPALRRTVLGLGQRATRHFTTLGVTWRHDPRVGAVAVQVRWRAASGWSAWRDLDGDTQDAPDTASPRDGTAPLWIGSARGVQARLTTGSGVWPTDVRVDLVDPGTSPADSHPGGGPRDTASASESQPAVLSRADWGADESMRSGEPSYSTTVKAGFVHHTDTATDYSPAQTAAMIRSIYAYHVLGHGWSDIGYNFLVDRFGRVWEGRYGGITRNVIGAHTGGFNVDSFGTALLGTFSTTAPPAASLAALERLFAWRLGLAYRDPLASATLVSGGGGTARWPRGTVRTFAVVSGHRDAGFTSCPGDATYARIGGIRSAVSGYLGTGFVDPTVSATVVDVGSRTPVVVRAGALGTPAWTLTVTTSTGLPIRTYAGAGAVTASWDLTSLAGLPAQPGIYTLRLTGTSANGDRALPWESTVFVRPPHVSKGAWLSPGGFSPRL